VVAVNNFPENGFLWFVSFIYKNHHKLSPQPMLIFSEVCIAKLNSTSVF